MTDRALRELERRARGGTREDEAAWLAARVRAGDLPRERVELAAWCGHEGARAVAGVGAADDLDLEGWLRGLSRWRRAPARAALAAARLAWPMRVASGRSCWRTEPASPVIPVAERTLAAASALLDEDRRAARTLAEVVDALDATLSPLVEDRPTSVPGYWRQPGSLPSAWQPLVARVVSNADWAWWTGAVVLLAGRSVLDNGREASASTARQAALLTRDLVARHPVAGEWSRPVRDAIADAQIAWALR